MPTNDYHFITVWRVESTIDEVSTILGDAPDLVRWWPSVYLEVRVLEPGDERGLGKVVSLYTKGWLPYTLRWDFRVTEVRNDGFTLVAWGDFDGRGIWTFEQDGEWVNVTYDWKIKAEKPLLRYFSFIMKPMAFTVSGWRSKRISSAMSSNRSAISRSSARARLSRTLEDGYFCPLSISPT